MPPVLRTLLAVIAGFLVINFVVIVFNLILVAGLHQRSGHPSTSYLVVNVIYSFLAGVAGGFVAALIDGAKPMRPALLLAGIMLVFGLFSYLNYRGAQPLWYQALMVLAIPLCAVAGAALCMRLAARAKQHA